MRILTGLLLILCQINVRAQEQKSGLLIPATGTSRKGQVAISWGYNRVYYNRSDVHFKGDGFDFTLEKARAEDMPEKFSPKVYFNPNQLSIPQFNFRIAYYFRDNTAFSIGTDHMKYHIITTQAVRINGHIDEDLYPDPAYTGDFHHEEILYNSEFMDFHHSNGFNFVRLALEQRVPFWKSRSGKQELALNGALSAGAVVPWTDFTFFGDRHLNKLHLSGYGFSISAGFRYEFLKWFFIQANAQAGWTNLPDIMLQDDLPSRADQKISFFERSFAVGGYIPFKRNKQINE